MHHDPALRKQYRWIGAMDSTGAPIGLLAYKRTSDEGTKASFLLSSPDHNPLISKKDREQQIRGIASALLLTLANQVPSHKLTLYSLPTADTFYTKLGFTPFPSEIILGRLDTTAAALVARGQRYAQRYAFLQEQQEPLMLGTPPLPATTL